MPSVKTHLTKLSELSWLAQVQKRVEPLNDQSRIWVRSVTVESSEMSERMTSPEVHPYCEIGTMIEGAGTLFVQREEVARKPGDIFLAGPGIPHWLKLTRYPSRFISVYFYPSLLMEQMPEADDVQMLRRFTAKQTLGERLVFPPPAFRRQLIEAFQGMESEFQQSLFGREVKLRARLLELIVDLLRWERKSGREGPAARTIATWQPLDRALQYLKEHYAEPIYSDALAQAAGVSKSRLKAHFHDGLGMPWSRYLQCYRVHMAAIFLNEPNRQIAETAFAVGFESLSHFNTTFRSIMGVSPGVYAKRMKGR